MTPVALLTLAATAAGVDPATLNPSDWASDFKPFTLFHLVTVAAFGLVMALWCWWGRRAMRRHHDDERRFRRVVGWAILVYQVWFLMRYFFPGNFTWERSLPWMLCDLAALLAGATLIWHKRWMRAVLYFWAIGLSTQAFFTPILQDGYSTLRYWTFWLGHTAIVGAAIYDLVVHRFRPSARDLAIGVGASLGYALVAIGLNLTIDRLKLLPPGSFANYGYLGNSTPSNPTLMDKLGPWPQRVFVVTAIVMTLYVALWAVWRLPFFRPAPGTREA